MRALPFVVALLLACVHAPAPVPSAPSPVATPEPPAPPALRDVTAAELIAQWPGKPATVLHVWATWCDPCVEEFPELARAWRRLSADGVAFQFVSADFAAAREEALAFLAEHGVDVLTYRKAEEDQLFIDAIDPRWSGTLPATFVVDRDGRIRFFREGQVTEDELVAEVTRVLCEPDHPHLPRSRCEPS